MKTRILGGASFLILAVVVYLGLWVTGPDVVQGQHVRLLYVHPEVAWVAYVAFGVTSLASVLWLIPATRRHVFDHVAGASAEIGSVFIALALITGAIWGRPTWGTWWSWDPRMTTTLMLLMLYLGVLALRRLPATFDARARRSAFAALLAFIGVPIVHQSVVWRRSLHQLPSILKPDITKPEIHGLQLWTMLLSFLGFTLVYVWLLIVRTRLARWEDQAGDQSLSDAIAARRAEAVTGTFAQVRS